MARWPVPPRKPLRSHRVLFAVAGTGTHGLAHSRADKRKAVALLLADAEWCQWSDREIAHRCQVDPKVVSRMRRDPPGHPPARTAELSSSGAEPHLRTSTPRAWATRPAFESCRDSDRQLIMQMRTPNRT